MKVPVKVCSGPVHFGSQSLYRWGHQEEERREQTPHVLVLAFEAIRESACPAFFEGLGDLSRKHKMSCGQCTLKKSSYCAYLSAFVYMFLSICDPSSCWINGEQICRWPLRAAPEWEGGATSRGCMEDHTSICYQRTLLRKAANTACFLLKWAKYPHRRSLLAWK